MRLLLRLVCIALAGVLAIAWWLSPSPHIELLSLVGLGGLALVFLLQAIKQRVFGLAGFAVFACFLGYAIFATNRVVAETDREATIMVKQFACAPSIRALQASNSEWKSSGSGVYKTISLNGASRRLSFQANGLLRWGLFDDADRTHWFPTCQKVGA